MAAAEASAAGSIVLSCAAGGRLCSRHTLPWLEVASVIGTLRLALVAICDACVEAADGVEHLQSRLSVWSRNTGMLPYSCTSVNDL